MTYFYATGSNGSIVEFDDGRFADTVSGVTSENVDAHQALTDLLLEAENMQAVDSTFGDFDANQIAEYVGA